MKALCAATAATAFLAACGGSGMGESGAATAEAAAAASASSEALSASAASASSIFYGVNGHLNEGGAYSLSSVQTQLAQLKALGAKIYRNEVYNAASAKNLANAAAAMQAGGVTIYPVLLIGPDACPNEAAAYNAGFALGQQTAQARKYAYYEVGNELDSYAIQGGSHDGIEAANYDNSRFVRARGVIRGMIAGIKSVDASGKIVISGSSWLHFGFDQMLANGTQPDGSAGHPKVSWDITAWHWYSDMGSIGNACGGSGCHNVLATLQTNHGKPVWLTEFGTRPDKFPSDAANASYLTGSKMMGEFASLASQYNLQSIQDYELYDDAAGGEGNYGLIKNDGKTVKAQYNAYKSFVASHPR